MTPPPGCRLFTVLVCKPALLLTGPTNVGCMLIYSQWGRRVLEERLWVSWTQMSLVPLLVMLLRSFLAPF